MSPGGHLTSMIVAIEPTEVQPIQYSGEYLRIAHTGREVLLLQGSVAKKTLGAMVSIPTLLDSGLHEINDSDFVMLTGLGLHTIDTLIPELHLRGIAGKDLTDLGLYRHDNGKKLLQSMLVDIQPITIEGSIHWSRIEIIGFVQKQFGGVTVEESNVNLGSSIYGIEDVQQKDRIRSAMGAMIGKDTCESHMPMTEGSRQEKINLLKSIFLTQSLQNNGYVLAYALQLWGKDVVLSIVTNIQEIDNYGKENYHFFMLQQSELFTQSRSGIVRGRLDLEVTK